MARAFTNPVAPLTTAAGAEVVRVFVWDRGRGVALCLTHAGDATEAGYATAEVAVADLRSPDGPAEQAVARIAELVLADGGVPQWVR